MRISLNIIVILVIFLFAIGGCSSQTQQNTDISSNTNQIQERPAIESIVVAKLSDLPEGSMKAFTYNGEPAMLVNFNGDVKAYSNKCPHKGLEFNEQSLKGDKIVCPWHGSTFSPTTGDYLGNVDGNNNNIASLTMINVKVIGENIVLA